LAIDAEKLRVAFHEAGHAVVARELGLTGVSLELSRAIGTGGPCEWRGQLTGVTLPFGIAAGDIATIGLAGPAAEARFMAGESCGSDPPQIAGVPKGVESLSQMPPGRCNPVIEFEFISDPPLAPLPVEVFSDDLAAIVRDPTSAATAVEILNRPSIWAIVENLSREAVEAKVEYVAAERVERSRVVLQPYFDDKMDGAAERLKAIHESAHAVIALLVGWKVASIRVGIGASGQCLMATGYPPNPRTQDIAHRDLLVYCAGFAAELISQGRVVPESIGSDWWSPPSATDRAHVRWIVTEELHRDRLSDRRRAVEAYFGLAFEVFQRHDAWALVNEMAVDLEQARRLDAHQVEAAWVRHNMTPAAEFVTAELDRLTRMVPAVSHGAIRDSEC
jgi:hypothetical protein